MRRKINVFGRMGLAAFTALVLLVTKMAVPAGSEMSTQLATTTTTPIEHLVVIFNENISFDHYFATYPNATNPVGEPKFTPAPNTPSVNGLNGPLLTRNPNLLNVANDIGAANPFRLDRPQELTADQNHGYTTEQQAYDFGLMDAFPGFTGFAGPPPSGPPDTVETKGLVMGYYDGNTVTALWNYAQRFALNDNSYTTDFGPSTVGALNLISGQTNGVVKTLNGPSSDWISDGNGGLTVIGDPDPLGDLCASGDQVQKAGQNIGDLLNKAGITWGWFQGGFDLTIANPNKTTGCSRSSKSPITGVTTNDYIPHHEPFQYYASTGNPTHLRPTSLATVGQTDQANHQYDIEDFLAVLKAGKLPSVSFVKPIAIQDGHPGYSSPLDEQDLLVTVINSLQQSTLWGSTAVVVLYDDSDGWYDHVASPNINQSDTVADQLTGNGSCGDGTTALGGVNPKTLHAQGRCGYGQRVPLLVISGWSKSNYVDQTLTDQSSVLRFIEDNWLGGERIGQGSFDALAGKLNNMFDFTHFNSTTLILDPGSGEPA